MAKADSQLFLSRLMRFVGELCSCLEFTSLLAEVKMVGEYVIMVGLGFLIGMIVTMGMMA